MSTASKGSDDLVIGEEKPPKQISTWRWILTFLGLCLGAMLYGLDTTIAADVQAAVYEDFGNIKNIGWVGIGFPTASVAVILAAGRLYSLFDTKWLLITSVVIFEAGSALCGGAPSMNALIVGRVIAGLGGCGMYLGALTFISALGAPQKLPLYNALTGVSWGAGAILGPVIGGAFSVSSATWRWAFYINLPLAAVMSPVYFFVIPSNNPRPDLNFKEKLNGFDWLGVVLNAGTFVLFITVVTFAGSTFAWSSPASIALWVVWGVVLLSFGIQQRFAIFTNKEMRIFPVHFLRSKELILLFIATVCAAASSAVTLYYIPLLFVFTRSDNALDAAVRLLPFIIVFIAFIMIAGALLPTFGRYSVLYIFGGALILTGASLMFTVRSDTSTGKIYGYEILIAAGCGITFQNAYAVTFSIVDKSDRPNGIGFINTAQIGMTAIALAISSCLYQNLGVQFLTHALEEYHLPKALLQASLGGVGSKVLGSIPPEAAAITVETIAYDISRLFGIPMAAGALLVCISPFFNHKKIDLAGDAVAVA